MSRTIPLAVLAWLALGSSAAADDLSTDKINTKIDRLSLTAPDGKPFAVTRSRARRPSSSSSCRSTARCRTATARSWPTMAKEYADKGVAFLGVASADETPDALAKLAAEFKLGFPVYADPKLAAADAFKADDHPRGVRPRPQPRPALPRPDRQRLLRPAQAEPGRHRPRPEGRRSTTLLAGQAVRRRSRSRSAVPIGNREVAAKPGAASGVTYHSDVLPILQTNCQGCHRPGEVGPFALMTYKQAVNWAEDIKEYTASREDAAVEAGRRAGVHQRPADERQGDRDPGRVGGRRLPGGRPEGRPAAGEVHRRLAARQAGPGAGGARGRSTSARPARTSSAASCCRPG